MWERPGPYDPHIFLYHSADGEAADHRVSSSPSRPVVRRRGRGLVSPPRHPDLEPGPPFLLATRQEGGCRIKSGMTILGLNRLNCRAVKLRGGRSDDSAEGKILAPLPIADRPARRADDGNERVVIVRLEPC